jgi:parallel beta-helix repeat protein
LAISRRTFLGMAASWPWLAGCVATIATPLAGADASVRRHGARGDAMTDDTDAFQQAIDAVAKEGGGVVTVQAGRYLLDPLRSVRLRSGVHLQIDAGATLLAKPNAADRSVLLLVQDASDVTITGGNLLGERDRHLGTTGEWGHGIQLRGAQRVVLRDIRVSNFWGDGVSVAAINPTRANPDTAPSTDVLLERIVSLGNRRQGLTIGRSSRVRVVDCEFAGTRGTAPESGIDIEPDAGAGAVDIEIARCRIHDNHGPGIQVWNRAQRVRIQDCTLQDNRYGVLLVGAEDTRIVGNRIVGNALNGVLVGKGARGATLDGNRFSGNGRQMEATSRTPSPGRTAQHQVRVAPDAQGVRLGADNHFE